jgi:hypothetical protein
MHSFPETYEISGPIFFSLYLGQGISVLLLVHLKGFVCLQKRLAFHLILKTF